MFNPEKNIDTSSTNIVLTNNKMICIKDNREIKDNDIVEMKYNINPKNGITWTPLRLRNDDKNIMMIKLYNFIVFNSIILF